MMKKPSHATGLSHDDFARAIPASREIKPVAPRSHQLAPITARPSRVMQRKYTYSGQAVLLQENDITGFGSSFCSTTELT
jgi:hypothetical protein